MVFLLHSRCVEKSTLKLRLKKNRLGNHRPGETFIISCVAPALLAILGQIAGDPVGRKHFKLKTYQLKALIQYVEHGGRLRTHDDVPEDIRQQIYVEEQQRLERHQRATNVSSSNMPPINITNVLPGPSSQSVMPASNSPSMPSCSVVAPTESLSIHGLRDIALKEYSGWQQSQVDDPILKAKFMKAYEMAMEDGQDLEQIHGDQNPDVS